MSDNGDWTENRKLVLDTLRRLEDGMNGMREDMAAFREEEAQTHASLIAQVSALALSKERAHSVMALSCDRAQSAAGVAKKVAAVALGVAALALATHMDQVIAIAQAVLKAVL